MIVVLAIYGFVVLLSMLYDIGDLKKRMKILEKK